MKLLIFTNSERGLACINYIKKNHEIIKIFSYDNFKPLIDNKYYLKCPNNINSKNFISLIKNLKPNIVLLAGFDQIFSENFIFISVNSLVAEVISINCSKLSTPNIILDSSC